MGIGGGYAIPTGSRPENAPLFYLEPSGRINDQWLLSFHLEMAFPANRFSPDDRTTPSMLSSCTFNGQYYINRLTSGNLRPFVGAGLGFYYAAMEGTTPGIYDSFGLFVGYYPRAGFDVGPFTLSVDYNIFPFPHTDSFHTNINDNYLAIHVGASIGGARQ